MYGQTGISPLPTFLSYHYPEVDFLPIDLTIERECNGELVKYNVNKEVADWKGDGTLDAFFKVN